MVSAEKELEYQLREAGRKLADPPSSVDELLPILDKLEGCLSRVEQSPTQSTQDALSPALKALIADKLFKHSDVDVKVAVASCLSEITRITAPDAPYDDDQMKEVFQLIVSSFENLHDMTSRSYMKRTSILETVAKVRSCVVMLDLECDAMILEMFHHFLKTIRDHHKEDVFSSMETIMSLVLEESEEITTELLSPILACVKKDNEEVLPIARKLGERVLESCATKIKPSLLQAVNTLGSSVDDYSTVVASICQDASGSLEQNDVCAASDHVGDENKSAKEPLEESAQVVREVVKEESAPPQHDNLVGEKSPKSVMSNGIAQAAEGDALADSKSQEKQDETGCSIQSKGVNLQVNEEPSDLVPEKAENSEQKPAHPTRKRARKSSSSAKSKEPSKSLHLANEKEDEKMTDSKSQREEVPSSPQEVGCAEAAELSDNDKEVDTKIKSPKTVPVESDVAPSSPSENLVDENLSKNLVRAIKEDSSAKEMAAEDVSKKASEETSDSEAKPFRRSAKNVSDRSSSVKKTETIKKGSGTSSGPDAKKHSAKTEEKGKKGGVGSSSKHSDDKKKQRGKINAEEKVSLPKSATKSTKDEHLEETPKTTLKRKHTPGKQNESNVKCDQSLVGSRIQVWWPEDEQYYAGVVDSFNRAKKKHKVTYDDGDVEVLHLPNEDWKIINAVSASDEEEGSDHGSADASDDMPPKKKGKSSAVESKKEGKKDAPSRSGGVTSSKSKGASVKSSLKSKDAGKSDRKSKDQTPKSGGSKSIDASQKSSGKSKNADGVKTSKSKDEDASMPKPSKSKQETPKTGEKSKQETSPKAGEKLKQETSPKSGEKSKQDTSKTASASKARSSKSGKSNTNGTGKIKSNLQQAKETDSMDSGDSTKKMEDDMKGKVDSGDSTKKMEDDMKGKVDSGDSMKMEDDMKAKEDDMKAKEDDMKAKVDDMKAKVDLGDSKKMEDDVKGKTVTSSKAGSDAKSRKKRARN